MSDKTGDRSNVRYSEAFKLSVVRELESSGASFEELRRKYQIGGANTLQKWVRKYGNGTRGKVIRVEKTEEISELERLKRRLKQVESAMVDTCVKLAISESTAKLLAKKAGVEDLEEFKKKAHGQ